jgi:hypothetical protein
VRSRKGAGLLLVARPRAKPGSVRPKPPADVPNSADALLCTLSAKWSQAFGHTASSGNPSIGRVDFGGMRALADSAPRPGWQYLAQLSTAASQDLYIYAWRRRKV